MEGEDLEVVVGGATCPHCESQSSVDNWCSFGSDGPWDGCISPLNEDFIVATNDCKLRR